MPNTSSPPVTLPTDDAQRLAWHHVAAVTAAAALVYLNALDNPFVYDDYRLILENPALGPIVDWAALVSRDFTRPFVSLSYGLDRVLWGPGPVGYHVTNLLLHLLDVVLVMFVAMRLLRDRARRLPDAPVLRPAVVATAAGLLFGLHPMMTEAVGYVSGRSELLCAAFMLGALLAVPRSPGGPSRNTSGSLVPAIVLWIGALLSKEPAVVWPLVFLLYDQVLGPPGAGDRRRRLMTVHAPLLAASAVFAAARLALFVGVEQGIRPGIVWSFALVEIDVVRRYLALLALPSRQAIFHDVAPIQYPGEPAALFALMVVGTVAAVAWNVRRRAPLVTVGVGWFLLTLVPSSVLVMLNRGEPMAEHRVYVASAGLFLGVAEITALVAWRLRTATRVSRLVAGAGAAVLVLSLGARTMLRNAIWSDPVTLWTEAVNLAPGHWLPLIPLGQELHRAGRHAEAAAAFADALRARPDAADALTGLGVCLIETGRLAEAAVAFESLRSTDPRSVEASNGLGTVALVSGRPEEARRRFEASLALDPDDVPARLGLATLEFRAGGNPAEGLRWCREARALAPGSAAAAACGTQSGPTSAKSP